MLREARRTRADPPRDVGCAVLCKTAGRDATFAVTTAGLVATGRVMVASGVACALVALAVLLRCASANRSVLFVPVAVTVCSSVLRSAGSPPADVGVTFADVGCLA